MRAGIKESVSLHWQTCRYAPWFVVWASARTTPVGIAACFAGFRWKYICLLSLLQFHPSLRYTSMLLGR